MRVPYITIDLEKIEQNARTIVELCRSHNIEVTGVTKGSGGNPDVARAMLRGGVTSIGESHLENIWRLKDADIDTTFMLLTVAPLSEVTEVIESVDVSLNSEIQVLKALSDVALQQAKVHNVVVMVDLGDLREGVWPDQLMDFVEEAAALPGINLKGIGTNLSCLGGVIPTTDNMNQLASYAVKIEKKFNIELEWVSGCNSSALKMIAAGEMPKRINHARIGEAILLGRETTHREVWPGTFQDAFQLHAEVVELKEKPSQPVGEQAEAAFGGKPDFEDVGTIDRAILNIGREDVDIQGLTPLDPTLKILGGSSDYVIVDVTAAKGGIEVGAELVFSLNYAALVAAMTSHYVEKCPLPNKNGETS